MYVTLQCTRENRTRLQIKVCERLRSLGKTIRRERSGILPRMICIFPSKSCIVCQCGKHLLSKDSALLAAFLVHCVDRQRSLDAILFTHTKILSRRLILLSTCCGIPEELKSKLSRRTKSHEMFIFCQSRHCGGISERAVASRKHS